jgi:hypothetical protein
MDRGKCFYKGANSLIPFTRLDVDWINNIKIIRIVEGSLTRDSLTRDY